MLKWERKLVEFLEKNMLILAALFISGIALLLRRQNIWFHTEDYIYYFDMHQGNIQSAVYFSLVKLLGYVFELPLHGIKWLTIVSDFAVAFLSVLLCGFLSVKKQGKTVWKKRTFQFKLLLLYAACLFAPVIYVRGCVWAQVDALAFVFLLAAAFLLEFYEKKGLIAAIVLGAVGVSVYPPVLLVVIGYCLLIKKQDFPVVKYVWLIVVVLAAVLEVLGGMAVDLSPKQSVISLFQWITFYPHTGVVYKNLGDWMWQQLLLFSYSASLVSLVGAFRKKLSLVAVVILQIVLAVCVGIALGW